MLLSNLMLIIPSCKCCIIDDTCLLQEGIGNLLLQLIGTVQVRPSVTENFAGGCHPLPWHANDILSTAVYMWTTLGNNLLNHDGEAMSVPKKTPGSEAVPSPCLHREQSRWQSWSILPCQCTQLIYGVDGYLMGDWQPLNILKGAKRRACPWRFDFTYSQLPEVSPASESLKQPLWIVFAYIATHSLRHLLSRIEIQFSMIK